MISSCVSRDIFGFKSEDNGWELNKPSGYSVLNYINFVSPLSLVSNSLDVDIDQFERLKNYYKYENPNNFSNFFWKCKYYDITKRIDFFLRSKNSDFFVMDNYIFSYDCIELVDGTILTNTSRKIVDFLINRTVLPPIKRIIPFLDMPEKLIDQSVEKLSQIIYSIYDKTKVILIDVRLADFFIKDSCLLNFDISKTKKINSALEAVFKIYLKYFKDAHVISRPDVIIADSSHKWGLHQVHFVNEFYTDYCLGHINLIVHNSDNIDRIKEIRENFENMLSCKYFNLFHSRLLQFIENKFETNTDVYRITTCHNTVVYFDYNQRRLIHSHKKANELIFDIQALLRNEKIYLYFCLNGKVFYVKSIISDDCLVELSSFPSTFDVVDNVSSISIKNKNKFLSATLNGDFLSLKVWNKAWEHFKLISYI